MPPDSWHGGSLDPLADSRRERKTVPTLPAPSSPSSPVIFNRRHAVGPFKPHTGWQ